MRGHVDGACPVSPWRQPDGSRIVSGSSDKTVHVWNAPPEHARLNDGAYQFVISVAFNHDGSRIVCPGTRRCCSNAATGTCEATLTGMPMRSVRGVQPRWVGIVSGSRDETVRVWNAATGTCEATLTGHDSYVLSVGSQPRWVAHCLGFFRQDGACLECGHRNMPR